MNIKFEKLNNLKKKVLLKKRLNSYGWDYIKIDGHNEKQIYKAIKAIDQSISVDKLKKIYLLVLISMFLTGCIQSTALLGPGVTIATTGNIMQAGFQYGANSAIKKETGKDAFTHLKDAVAEEKENPKLQKNIRNLAQNTIQKIKKKLLIN